MNISNVFNRQLSLFGDLLLIFRRIISKVIEIDLNGFIFMSIMNFFVALLIDFEGP